MLSASSKPRRRPVWHMVIRPSISHHPSLGRSECRIEAAAENDVSPPHLASLFCRDKLCSENRRSGHLTLFQHHGIALFSPLSSQTSQLAITTAVAGCCTKEVAIDKRSRLQNDSASILEHHAFFRSLVGGRPENPVCSSHTAGTLRCEASYFAVSVCRRVSHNMRCAEWSLGAVL